MSELKITKKNVIEVMNKAIAKYDDKKMFADVLFWTEVRKAIEILLK